jgi:hypothetical protein
VAFAVAASCDDDDDDNNEDADGDDDNDNNDNDNDDTTIDPPGTVTDPATGLMWQLETLVGAEGLKSYDDAFSYCADLVFADFDDWILPTLSALRSICTCPLTRLDGSCEAADDCLTTDCGNTVFCDGCYPDHGGDNGCYWWPVLEGYCGASDSYWSLAPVIPETYMAWWIRFCTGEVHYEYKDELNRFRCVRGGNGEGGPR